MKVFFLKFFLSIIAIVSICFTSYYIFSKPINTMEKMVTATTEKRVQENKNYEKKVYDAMIAELANEKLKYYIIMIGVFSAFMLFGFHVVKLMLRVNSEFFMYPDKYEIVAKDEADAMRYIKDKMLEARVLKPEQMLTRESVMMLLSHDVNDIDNNRT